MATTIMPTLRYEDADAAIKFLTSAFGFETKALFRDDAGTVSHAELTHGPGMVMIGSARDSEFGRLLESVEEAGRPTSGIYVIVGDVEAHAAQAEQAGAKILIPVRTQDYGGTDYTCSDPEGVVWSFGNYNPWTAEGG